MRWLFVVMFACLATTAVLRAEEAGNEEKALSPDQLVEQLADESYARRERAREELERREFDAREALQAGLASDDLEVRYHCERILSDIQERITQRNLDEFVANAGKDVKYDFPAWAIAKEALGDTPQARKMFVEMYRAESDTLKLLEKNDESLVAHAEARSRFLQRRAQGLYQAPLKEGNLAALLLAAGSVEGKFSAAGHAQLFQLCYQQQFRDAMQGSNGPQMRKLFGRYLKTTSDQSAYQGMTLTMQYDMKEEGLALAEKILDGKATLPHVKQYAVLTCAKLGDEKQIERLKSLLEDKTVCSQMNINKVMYKTELRDIALFGMVHLKKQDPKKFGFNRFSPNPQMLANVHTLGFENDDKRKEAFELWKKFEAEQASKVAEGEKK